MQAESKDSINLERKVAFRCTCGADVLLAIHGTGTCSNCGRTITLGRMDPTHTISFCSDIGSGTSFQLNDGHDRTGESLGHFRLMSRLGFGGMGAVYRALDESLQRFVAVKVIRSTDGDASVPRKLVSRLLNEAIAQARLNHPNVVTIYYVGREGEEPFFAMELLPGPTLAQVIDEGPLAFDDVIRFARQVCSALSHANRLGLVHGDIKPSNLILAGDETVKLSDFGLSKTEESVPAKGISGTITHMAPELARGGSPTIRSDMYSLGITLFELTFGRLPFCASGTTLRDQLDSQHEDHINFPDKRKWPSTVPERFREVLTRMLARDPEKRYESFEQLDSALKEYAPVGVTSASLISRAFALGVDFALLGILMLPFVAAAQFAGQEPFPDYLRWFVPLVLLVPAIATWAERSGIRTLGRYLLQLRVVDNHGLLLDHKKRFWRSLFRNSPVWVGAVTTILIAFQLDVPAALISPVYELIILVDLIPALAPRRQAFHDRLVGSHVVLDTAHPEK